MHLSLETISSTDMAVEVFLLFVLIPLWLGIQHYTILIDLHLNLDCPGVQQLSDILCVVLKAIVARKEILRH